MKDLNARERDVLERLRSLKATSESDAVTVWALENETMYSIRTIQSTCVLLERKGLVSRNKINGVTFVNLVSV